MATAEKTATKTVSTERTFKVGDYVVYPAHGVGRVTSEEKDVIAGIEIKMLVISFDKDKMTLRVPVKKANAVGGLRHLSSADQMKKALTILRGRAKVSRGMWSRRAQEYENKINSGDIVLIAEVVRDLHKNVDDPDRSFSERQIYEAAFDRLLGEFGAVEGIDKRTAEERLGKMLKVKEKEAAEAA